MVNGGLIQLISNGASDIYLHGNPQKGMVPYGIRAKQNSHSNPYCPTLEYSFIENNEEHIFGSKEIYEKYWGLKHGYEHNLPAEFSNTDLSGTIDYNADDPNLHIILPDFPKDKLMTQIINEKNLPIHKTIDYKDYEQEYKTTNRDKMLIELKSVFKIVPWPKENGILRNTDKFSYAYFKYRFNNKWLLELKNFVNIFIKEYYNQFEYKDTIIPIDAFPTDYNLCYLIKDFLIKKGYIIYVSDDYYYIV
jgi:hypothetical protein